MKKNNDKLKNNIIKEYKCNGCSKVFIDRIKRNNHSRIHGKFKCKFCTKVCPRKDQLKEHVLHIHLKQKNYICKHCDKKYYKSGYKYHIKNTRCKIYY